LIVGFQDALRSDTLHAFASAFIQT
jgi:hypothetical protein